MTRKGFENRFPGASDAMSRAVSGNERGPASGSEKIDPPVLESANKVLALTVPDDINSVLNYGVKHGQYVEQAQALQQHATFRSLQTQIQKQLEQYEVNPSAELSKKLKKNLSRADFQYRSVMEVYEHYKETTPETSKIPNSETEKSSEDLSTPEEPIFTEEAESDKDEKEDVPAEPPFELMPDMRVDAPVPDTDLRYTPEEAEALVNAVDGESKEKDLHNPDAHEAFAAVREARNDFVDAKRAYLSLLKRTHEQPENEDLAKRLKSTRERLETTRRKRYEATKKAHEDHKKWRKNQTLIKHPLHKDKPESLQSDLVKLRMVNALARSIAEERSRFAVENIRNNANQWRAFTALRAGLQKGKELAGRHKATVGIATGALALLALPRKAIAAGAGKTAELAGYNGGAVSGSVMTMLSTAALGAWAGRALGAGVGKGNETVRARASQKEVATAKDAFAADTITELENALLNKDVSAAKSERFTRRAKTAGTVGGALAGLWWSLDVDGAAEEVAELTEEAPELQSVAPQQPTAPEYPRTFGDIGTLDPDGFQDPTPGSEIPTLESVDAGETVDQTPEVQSVAPQEPAEPTIPEGVGDIGTLDPDGFQDRTPGSEIPTPAELDSTTDATPAVENLVPNPEQAFTVPDGSSVSESFYQAYHDGELDGLPEGMGRSEFLNKMYAAIHAVDNNEAIMSRMDLPSGDIDQIAAGDSFNAAPLIEHMNGMSIEEIEQGLYAPEDALAREGETLRATAVTESLRPEARPDDLDTSSAQAPNESLRPEARPDDLAEGATETSNTISENSASREITGNFESMTQPLFADIFGENEFIADSYKLHVQEELQAWADANGVYMQTELSAHAQAIMTRDRVLADGIGVDLNRIDFENGTGTLQEQMFLRDLDTPAVANNVSGVPALQPYFDGARTQSEALIQAVKDGAVRYQNGEIIYETQ